MDTRKKQRTKPEQQTDSLSDEETPPAPLKTDDSKDIPPPIKRPDTLQLGAPGKSKDPTISETLLSDLLGRLEDLTTKVNKVSTPAPAVITIPDSYQKMLFTKFTPGKITPKFVEESLEQFESWLKMTKIDNDDERFHLLKMLIEPETYQHVGTIISSPPITNKYETLRNAIIKAFTETEAARIKALLSGIQLGNRRPSQLLAEMSNLYKGTKDKLFHELFIGRLPPTVRGILVSMQRNQSSQSQPPSIDTIAQWADAIMEQSEPQNSVNQIMTEAQQPDNLMSTLNGLINKIDNYTRTSNNARKQFNPKNRKQDDICYYHRKFGKGKHLNRKCNDDCRLHEAWIQNQHKQKND
jgi:hypothetical protein